MAFIHGIGGIRYLVAVQLLVIRSGVAVYNAVQGVLYATITQGEWCSFHVACQWQAGLARLQHRLLSTYDVSGITSLGRAGHWHSKSNPSTHRQNGTRRKGWARGI